MLRTPNMLDEIIAHKRKEVAARKQAMSYAALRENLGPSARSLEQALRQPGSRFILEYKRASPSHGAINPGLTVEKLCAAYKGFADAVSVLTDEKFFAGRLDDLRQVSDRLCVPVLCKDFILEPWQVLEARRYGADAVLLMLSVLDDARYQECARMADEFALDILTEVHTEAEMARALGLGAKIIGINNRDLKSLQTDTAVTERLAPKAPPEGLLISESGIVSRRDIVRLAPQVDGFLVGTALTAHRDLRAAVKRLLFGEIKICGITNSRDARLAEAAGAAYLGLLCYKKSPRFIRAQEAEALTKSVPAKYVGVFVNAGMEEMVALAGRLKLHAVQCHGEESPALLASLRKQLPEDCRLWKAIGYSEKSIEQQISQIEPLVDRLLVDKLLPQVYGGSGQRFDWRAIGRIQSLMRQPEKLILAGGINFDNLHELEEHPELSLDISSGVERAPGVKSAQKLRQLFQQRRSFPGNRHVLD